jgi:tetratricopeptide (TPR) repeat protein
MEIESTVLDQALSLYDQGLYIQAYNLMKKYGPVEKWRGLEARLFGGRLAMNLGSQRLGSVLHYLAWRENREDPEALFYYSFTVRQKWGILGALELYRRHPEFPQASATQQADWLSNQSLLAAEVRDFDRADSLFRRAESLSPDNAWIYVQRASALGLEDRYEEALAMGEKALDLHPWFRPGIQSVSHSLQMLNRDQDALDLLKAAVDRMESAWVLADLAMLQSELGLHEESRKNLGSVAELLPLMDKPTRKWLEERLSDAAYHCGDF